MFVIEKHHMLYGVLAFIWIEFFWELYLSIRQYNLTMRSKQIPGELKSIMTKDTFDKARLYSIHRMRFSFVKDLFSITLTSLVIYKGYLADIWSFVEKLDWNIEGEVATSCIWLFIVITIQTLIGIPWNVYNTFVLEQKYGFNKQTPAFYIWDSIKSYILSQVLTHPIASLMIVIIKYGGEYFFFWLWLTSGAIILIFFTIYHDFIAPLFDKFRPLEGGELRTRIESLAADLNFPLTKLYVVEGSKRSSHSNAYFYGFFKNKCIVLYDTLFANSDSGGCNNDEILAVLSHELGHWYHNHVAKNIIISQVNLLLTFLFFSFTFKSPLIYQCVGFRAGLEPVIVGLIVTTQIVMAPYNALISFCFMTLLRRFENQADAFAVKLGKAEPLAGALIQLTKDNLGFPIYDKLYSSYHHSHPPLLERLSALKKTH